MDGRKTGQSTQLRLFDVTVQREEEERGRQHAEMAIACFRNIFTSMSDSTATKQRDGGHSVTRMVSTVNVLVKSGMLHTETGTFTRPGVRFEKEREGMS